MLMNIFTHTGEYIYTFFPFVITQLLPIISPVSIAFATYVYFANKRIKNKLSKDEELKNSKKDALLDSFHAGLIVEAILSLTKISAGTALFTIAAMVGIIFEGGVSYDSFRYIFPNRYLWSTIKPILDLAALIWIFCVSYGFQMIVKYFVMKLILKKNNRKLKFKEMFSGLLISTLAGIALLINEYLVLGFLLINIKNLVIFK